MVVELKSRLREVQGKQLVAFRQRGEIPGIIYGQDVSKNPLIFVDSVALNKIFVQAGQSTIINLQVEGEKKGRDVLIKEISRDPVRDTIIHVDFYQIKEGQKLEVAIKIKLIGAAPAVKDLGGILVQNIDQLTVRCLPKEIISEIVVDVSNLKALADRILVKDLALPTSFEVMARPEEVVAMVAVVAEEKEEVAPTAAMPETPAATTPTEGTAPAAEDKKKE